jgi:hypothetical protein
MDRALSVRLALGATGLVLGAACHLSHEPDRGIPITIVTAELDVLTLPHSTPEPARGALVRAERCEDGDVRETRTDGAGVAVIDFGHDADQDCWTLSVVLPGARPSALTLLRTQFPLPAPIVLDQRGPIVLPSSPSSDPTDVVTVAWHVEGRAREGSGITLVGSQIDVDGRTHGGFAPILDEPITTAHARSAVLAEEALFAIEWLDDIPINATRVTIGPIVDGVAGATIAFPSPATLIHRVRLPFALPQTGPVTFGPFPPPDPWWGTGGFVRGVRAGGGTSILGQLLFDHDDALDPPWSVEAIWPDLPWTEVFPLPPQLSFVFVRSELDEEVGIHDVHGFVEGPIAEGSHLEIPPVEQASLLGALPDAIEARVGGEGHVGFLFFQAGGDAFLEYSRYRIYSAPNEPLVLDTWPTLPGGLTLDDLGLEGDHPLRASIGVADPHGNPGFLLLPTEDDRGRRLVVRSVASAGPHSLPD